MVAELDLTGVHHWPQGLRVVTPRGVGSVDEEGKARSAVTAELCERGDDVGTRPVVDGQSQLVSVAGQAGYDPGWCGHPCPRQRRAAGVGERRRGAGRRRDHPSRRRLQEVPPVDVHLSTVPAHT